MEDETEEAWKMDVTAAFPAAQRLRSEGDAHKDMSVLTQTIKRHNDFGRADFCSTKPSLRTCDNSHMPREGCVLQTQG